jgi:hypothetical protein
MTYAEIAELLGISTGAARQLARRHKWPRRTPNEYGAVAHVLVPPTEYRPSRLLLYAIQPRYIPQTDVLQPRSSIFAPTLVPTAGQYIGRQGLAAYQAAGHPSATYIPVDSAGAHWSEAALGNELMTPYINSSNYLSSFSLMSLADLGYQVQPLSWPGNPTV